MDTLAGYPGPFQGAVVNATTTCPASYPADRLRGIEAENLRALGREKNADMRDPRPGMAIR